jgi:mono/diheme cytochrome c family protein
MSVDIDPRAQVPSEPPDERHDEADVTSMHQQVMREHDEPRDGLEPVPMWFSFLTAALFFVGGYYLSNFSGGFQESVFDENHRGVAAVGGPKEEPPLAFADAVSLGRQIYTANCQQCHQSTGQGQPGQYPPLAGSDWVVGDKTSAARLARILLYGLNGRLEVTSGVANSGIYNGNMPAWGKPAGSLSDRQVAAVLTFIRNEWGNKGVEVTKDQVQAVHKALGTRGPMTEAELLAVTEEVPAAGGTAAPTAPPGTPAPTPSK